LEEKLTSYFC